MPKSKKAKSPTAPPNLVRDPTDSTDPTDRSDPTSVLPHLPWLLGLLLAPLLFGTLYQASKVVVGALFTVSLFLLTTRLGGEGSRRTVCPPVWVWLAVACTLLPILPLPVDLAQMFSPQRVALQQQFPVNAAETPGFLSLTLSTTAMVQRLADLALIIAGFWLARCAAANPRSPRWFVVTLTLSIGLLAASEVWFRFDGQEKLLGLIPDRAGHAAGTFPNRNHFAGYIYVASLFLGGWLLRQRWPLRFSRGCTKEPPGLAGYILIAATVVFGLIMATRTGSRGGLLAFLIGTLTWLALLASRSPSRHRQLRLFGAVILILFLVTASSEFVLSRLAHLGNDLAFKTALWRDASGLTLRFPMLGTGTGTFAVAFNHFKSFAGDRTFLHAENEWVQLWVEHGFLGATLLLIPLGFFVWASWRFVQQEKPLEPELAFGGAAALACFGFHSLFEFVFQIPANAILAAVLAGFLMGSRDETSRPVVVSPPGFRLLSLHMAGSLTLLAFVSLQAVASFQAHQAVQAQTPAARVNHLKSSLTFWPWETERAIALTRQEIKALPDLAKTPGDFYRIDGARIRTQLDQAIRLDPFNWELRLERTWLDLTFSTDQSLALEQARQCARLNPLQPNIPLQFARHFAPKDPALALEFLETAPLQRKEDFHQALELAWRLKADPSALWSIISDTPAGLQALAEFAEQHALPELADQARARRVAAR